MLTSYGKFLRKLRIDQGELLKHMAEKLEVSSAFLSAVENGKKKIPKTWNARLSELYQLTADQVAELQQSQQESEEVVEIALSSLNQKQRETAFAFARSLERFDTQDLSQLVEIFNKKEI